MHGLRYLGDESTSAGVDFRERSGLQPSACALCPQLALQAGTVLFQTIHVMATELCRMVPEKSSSGTKTACPPPQFVL